MAIMIHAKFHFNWLMLTLIFSIWAWRSTEKAGPDRVKFEFFYYFDFQVRKTYIKIFISEILFIQDHDNKVRSV